jgi:uncharacterized protein (DUF362 family)
MSDPISRRQVLSGLGAAALGLSRPRAAFSMSAPAGTVAIGKCRTYDRAAVLSTLQTAFDQLGGLGRLVKGKTVSIKLNLNGGPNRRLGYLPLEESHFPHPVLVGAAMQLMGKAGAQRVRLLESAWAPSTAPLEDHLMEAGWDWRLLMGTVPKVEFENTNFLGTGKKYSRFKVPFGGFLYPAYDLNHCYEDCDVFISITKPKDHSTCGVTLGMKNIFGTTPLTLYGSGVGIDKDNEIKELPNNGRMEILHYGRRQPSSLVLPEIDPNSSRDDGYRIPRCIVDLVAARPVHLTIIDAVLSIAGGQGAGLRSVQTKPGLIVVGNNPVGTDAVMTALMNYDPAADKGQTPFVTCDNTMALGESVGLGTRDLNRIEVAGAPIKDNICDYLALRKARQARPGPGVGPQRRT